MSNKEKLRIVIVGHVDHGKSTLIGRLFYDTDSIPQTRIREIEETCRRQGREFEYAYLMDALEEERDQNVTIDTAQTFFSSDKRDYVIIDAPGHEEFLKNMVTGAASADVAVLLVDGVEGVREQTRRHAHLLSLLGIGQVIVAVNKLDKINYDEARFHQVEDEARAYLHTLGIVATEVIPVSAREGENIAHKLGHTPYYQGPTVLEALDASELIREQSGLPLRLPVQDVYKWDGRRVYAGRVETGSVSVGDEVVFAPSGRRTRVKTVEKWLEPGKSTAVSGESTALTFTDEIFVERGEVLTHAGAHQRTAATEEVTTSLFWLAKKPFRLGATYTFKLGTAEVEAVATEIVERTDAATLAVVAERSTELLPAETATVTFKLRTPIAADPHGENPTTGRFVVQDGVSIGGGGIIRALKALDRAGSAEVYDLTAELLGEDARPLDLRNKRGAVEFRADEQFLSGIRAGGSLRLLLGEPDQIEHVARFAFEHHVEFTFRRDGNRIGLRLGKLVDAA